MSNGIHHFLHTHLHAAPVLKRLNPLAAIALKALPFHGSASNTPHAWKATSRIFVFLFVIAPICL